MPTSTYVIIIYLRSYIYTYVPTSFARVLRNESILILATSTDRSVQYLGSFVFVLTSLELASTQTFGLIETVQTFVATNKYFMALMLQTPGNVIALRAL